MLIAVMMTFTNFYSVLHLIRVQSTYIKSLLGLNPKRTICYDHASLWLDVNFASVRYCYVARVI